jgi:uncharacterized protein YggE
MIIQHRVIAHLLLLSYTVLSAPAICRAQFPFGAAEPLITVDGRGQVTAEPDLATIEFSVVTQNTALQVAKEQNDQAAERVLSCLTKAGIENADIQTSQVQISPQWKEYNDPTSVYYHYIKSFRVTIRDLTAFTDIFNSVIAAGANKVDNVLFDSTKRNALETEARGRAIAAARAKAQQMAVAFGQGVGEPVHHHDYLSDDQGTYMGGLGGGIDSAERTVASGVIAVSVEVTITFRLLQLGAKEAHVP